MYECNYSREPINYRLLVLRLLKKIWLIPVSMVAGAVIVFGAYFIFKTVISGRTYLVENKYYIDFAEDSSGAQYTWVNQYTWSELADMDVFIEPIYQDLNAEVSKEDIRKSSDCTTESDVRYLYMRITTHDPVLSKRIADSYEKALFAFCEEHKEFNSIQCEHKGETVDNSNIRTVEMLIVGALAGLLVLIVVLLTKEVVDTSIYIPATLEYRYHIPSVLTASMKEFDANVAYFLTGATSTALVLTDDNSKEEVERIKADLKVRAEAFENPCENPDNLEKIKCCDKVVLCVKAACDNGKRIERVIEQLSRINITIDCVMLTNEDAELIKRYYR